MSISSAMHCENVSNSSQHLFTDWFELIHLACQSQVCELQHFSMAEKRMEGGIRDGEEFILVV